MKKTPDNKPVAHLDLTVAGVPVHVRLDDDGRPRCASAGFWDDPKDAGLVRLAAEHGLLTTMLAADTSKRRREATTAWNESARVRAEASTEHPANAWLALAYAEHPEHGRKKLAHAARRLAVAAEVDSKECDEITEDRARRFLERRRNAGQ